MSTAVNASFTTSVDTVDRNYEITLLCSELLLHKQIADETPCEETRIIAASLSIVANRY